jgi:hypothetical protein
MIFNHSIDMMPIEAVFSKNRNNLPFLKFMSRTLSNTSTLSNAGIVLSLFKLKKYKDLSFIELTTYLASPIFVISDIPIDGTNA